MTVTHIDFETQSSVDLKSCGLRNYVSSPDFRILCMAYATDKADIRATTCRFEMAEIILSSTIICAHNAAFERAVISGRLGLDVPAGRFNCTMARAMALSLPGGLDVLVRALSVPVTKLQQGRTAMMWFNRVDPKTGKLPNPEEHPHRLEKTVEYCKNDVLMEMLCDERLPPLQDQERSVWLLDQEINARGVGIDISACQAALRMRKTMLEQANQKMKELTAGEVSTISETKKLFDWAKANGYDGDNLLAGNMRNWIATNPDGLLRQVLSLRESAQKTSVAKYEAALKRQKNGRVHDLFQYHGAATGRWAGRGLQLQNLTRPVGVYEHPAVAEYVFSDPALLESKLQNLPKSPLESLAYLVRGVLIPTPGTVFMGGDLANIEGRVLAWAAGDEEKIERFAKYDLGQGPDIYLVTAAQMFNVSVETAKPQRFIGKVAELALGYGGSKGAFLSMARLYGVDFSEEEAMKIVYAWRQVNHKAVKLWKDVEQAAKRAICAPATLHRAGAHVTFTYRNGGLCMILPSGRRIFYPEARLEDSEFGTQITYAGYPPAAQGRNKNQWGRVKTYGGKMVENLCQAIARDVLAYNMAGINAVWPVVLHVHDEVVCEVPQAMATPATLDKFQQLLCHNQPWAKGLPLSSSVEFMPRYKK